MLSKRNCWNAHVLLTFFILLWFFSIFSIFCGPQHREIEIIVFLKTGYCPNYSRFKPSKYWKHSILMAIPTSKSRFHKNMLILFCLLSHGVLYIFLTTHHNLVTVLNKNSQFWRDFIILTTFLISFCEGLLCPSYRKHVFASFGDHWCCYSGRKY